MYSGTWGEQRNDFQELATFSCLGFPLLCHSTLNDASSAHYLTCFLSAKGCCSWIATVVALAIMHDAGRASTYSFKY
jgi:hypothetical protein